MSGFEIIGIVSSIIAVVDTTIKICKAAKELPQDLRVIAEMLPLIHDIIQMCGVNIKGGEVDEKTKTSIRPALKRCEENARILYNIVERALPKSSDSPPERAAKAGRVVFSRVKDAKILMDQIYHDLALLQQQQIFQSADLLENIEKGIDKLTELANENGGKYANYGSGPQYNNIHEGWGAQNVTNNTNSGGSGPAYFGTTQTFHSS